MLHHRAGELSTADSVLHHLAAGAWQLVLLLKPYSVDAKLWSSTALLSKPTLAELAPALLESSALLAAVLVRAHQLVLESGGRVTGRSRLSLYSPRGPQSTSLPRWAAWRAVQDRGFVHTLHVPSHPPSWDYHAGHA